MRDDQHEEEGIGEATAGRLMRTFLPAGLMDAGIRRLDAEETPS